MPGTAGGVNTYSGGDRYCIAAALSGTYVTFCDLSKDYELASPENNALGIVLHPVVGPIPKRLSAVASL